MSTQSEIAELEASLRVAELESDPAFFEQMLADDAVFVAPERPPSFDKLKVVALHQPGHGPKFKRVDIFDMRIVDHGTTAVVMSRAIYEGPEFAGTLSFMRVWVKKHGRWQIVAASSSI